MRTYNLLFDENNYIIDFTSWPTALPYTPCQINGDIPPNLGNKCYRFIAETGTFELDEAKLASITPVKPEED